MLRIQDKLLEDFAAATVEENYYRVGNIFYFLKAKRTFVNLHYGEQTLTGRISRVLSDHIRIIFRNFKEGQERRAIITFEALNRYYMCEILIRKTEGEIVEIQFPEKLQFITRRLYPRVQFDDLFMRFITLYSQFFHSKEEERALENSYPEFFAEIREDNPSLRILYQLITGEVRKITSDFDIKMYRENEFLSYDNLIERLVMGEGKYVLVENTSDKESYTRKFAVDLIDSLESYYADIVSQKGTEEADKAIEVIQRDDISEFRLSYFALPIIIFDRPRGYFIMRTNLFDKRNISAGQATDIARLFRIFSYAATKVKIRASHFDPNTIRTRVVNMSMSGLLMEIEDATLFEYLKKNRRVKMLIPIMGEELEVYGEIIRFYAAKGYYYLGVLFFKTRPGDMVKLEEYLYENRSYQFF